jgi:tetrahydromethanopterin S-methyltransferase subunit H
MTEKRQGDWIAWNLAICSVISSVCNYEKTVNARSYDSAENGYIGKRSFHFQTYTTDFKASDLLLTFDNEQKTFSIGKVRIGGKPGELPTVLIGSIFYEKHRIVTNPQEGAFDRNKAEELLKRQEEMSDKTGNPHMVDIVALTGTAIKKYVDFVSSVSDAPFLVDSTLAEVRLAGLKHSAEIGLLDRVVYNSITFHVSDEEINSLKNTGAKSAVLLGYNPGNIRPQGRVDLLRGKENTKGLLQQASDAGVQNILIDTAVLDVPSIGLAAEAIKLVKKEFGLPCGAGPLNAVLEWKRVAELGEDAKKTCAAAAVTAMVHAGASWVLYGPMCNSGLVFPAVAMVDSIIAFTLSRMRLTTVQAKNHPLYKIF